MNEEAIMEFAGKVVGAFTGMTVANAIWLGDEVGLYGAMAEIGPSSADAVAGAAGCNPRIVTEWLDGQVAAGLVEYDVGADTYGLSDEGVLVLANVASPVFMARGAQAVGSVSRDIDKLAAAFKSDGAMAWGDHNECLFHGVEWFFRTGYQAHLAASWIPSLDGVSEKLAAGAAIADVGCGHGASAMVLANSYPDSTVACIDMHGPSIATAQERAEEAGVADRVSFQVADAQGYEGSYDLICFFDCLHDMGDPEGAARYAREHLNEGGSVLLVEPFAHDGKTANIANNPVAAMFYSASAMMCVPCSLAQDVGTALGGQAGEARLREVFMAAGFSSLTRASETPFNLILQGQ